MNKNTSERTNRPAFPKHRQRSAGFILSGFAVATAVSTGLFWVMYQLISIAQAETAPVTTPRGIPFVMLKRELQPIAKPREKATPPPVVDQPMPPSAPELSETKAGPSFSFPKPSDEDLFGNKGGGPIGIGEREYMSLTEIRPNYPQRAITRGIEGTCVVVYTITKTGSVQDARVDESRCTSTLFHASALKAVSKFKYAPRVVDGEEVEARNVTKLFRFSITD